MWLVIFEKESSNSEIKLWEQFVWFRTGEKGKGIVKYNREITMTVMEEIRSKHEEDVLELLA